MQLVRQSVNSPRPFFRPNSRLAHTAKLLLDLINTFPMSNPSHPDNAELDVVRLFNQIRARYKMLCSQAGVRPSFRASSAGAAASPTPTSDETDGQDETTHRDTSGRTGKTTPVWKLTGKPEEDSVDLSF